MLLLLAAAVVDVVAVVDAVAAAIAAASCCCCCCCWLLLLLLLLWFLFPREVDAMMSFLSVVTRHAPIILEWTKWNLLRRYEALGIGQFLSRVPNCQYSINRL